MPSSCVSPGARLMGGTLALQTTYLLGISGPGPGLFWHPVESNSLKTVPAEQLSLDLLFQFGL